MPLFSTNTPLKLRENPVIALTARVARAVVTLALLVPAICLASAPQAASAAPAAVDTAAESSAFGELMGIVLPLVLIIVVLLAVLYLVRRRFGLTGQDAPLSILQILPLGPRERLVLVRSRSGRIFTVGVAAQGVSLVTHLEPDDLIAAAPPSETPTSDTSRTGETAVSPDMGPAR